MARIQTAEKTFIFDLSEDGENLVTGTKYLDLGQVHALCNRFATRQGYEYVVQSLEIGVNGGGNFTASIYRLPEHWPCINAWEKTMRHWKEQQDESARDSGLESTEARYRDFKVHFDQGHVTAGVANNLIPAGFDIGSLVGSNYEWNMSQVVLPNAGGSVAPTEVYLHMLGADTHATPLLSTSCGVIQAYAESRSRPQRTDPNIVDVDADATLYGAMENVAEIVDDVIENFQEHNHVPPYLIGYDGIYEFYPGGSLQGIGPADGGGATHPGQLLDVLAVNANHNYNSDTMGGFVAPCGLVKIEYSANGVLPGSPPAPGMPPLSFWMKVILAPGEYKGVLAQSMQEAN